MGYITKVALNILKWVENACQFMKSFNKKSHERYYFEIDVQYPEKRHDLHNHLPAPPERTVIEKVGKVTTKLHDKRYVIHITLKQAVNH